jgi:rubrerythrin
MDPEAAIVEILKKAYQIEVDGYTFYSMTADRADKPAVQELFAKLASDEVQHQAFLRTVLGRYHQAGVSAFLVPHRTPEMRQLTDKVFTDRFREQAKGASFELGVLSVGMTLESNAVAYFSSAAAQASDGEVRDFYQFLAGWEKQHLDALQTLHEAVRGDFWAQSSFAPF